MSSGEFEQKRHGLCAATHDIIRAESAEEVGEIVTDIISELVGLSRTGIYLHDTDVDALVPIEWTDSLEAVIDRPPVLGEGSLAWEVFTAGESQLFEDLSSQEGAYNQDTPLQSEFIVPLDEEGAVLVSSSDPAVFDEENMELIEMVCANATAALERLERERELRGFKKAVEHAGHSILITDTDGTIEYVNPAFEEITGYTAAEARGETPRILKSGEHDQRLYTQMWRTILDGEEWHAELINEGKDGQQFVVNQTIAPIVGADGNPQQFVAVNHDITERKEMERKLHQQRDNLDLLNQTMRHDIRNDLQLILSYGELLEGSVDETEEDYLETLIQRAESAVERTQNARDIAEVMLQADTDLEAVPLPAVLHDELKDAQVAFPSASITVEGDVPSVCVEANDMLSSVFRNLFKNAVKHNDKNSPKVSVSTEVDDDTVVVSVADNGPGVPDDEKAAIFGEGEKGLDSQGTGIGLHLVQTLLDTYGGDIWVDDNDPEGAIFRVELSLSKSNHTPIR